MFVTRMDFVRDSIHDVLGSCPNVGRRDSRIRIRERDKDILISIVVADHRRRRRRCRQFHASNGPSLLSRTAKRVELIK